MHGALGVEPVTSPPIKTGTDELNDVLSQAAAADIFALNLHGFYGQSHLQGQKNKQIGPITLIPGDIARHDWSGCVVFMEVCFSASGVPGNKALSNAFLDAGAIAVIGSTTSAYGRVKMTLPIPGSDGEADRLLRFFVKWMRRDKEPREALRRAKANLRLWSFPLDKEDRKTLSSFVVMSKKLT